MFFISGINAVLPFVLYIFLIWICLLISHGDKLKGIVLSIDPRYSVTSEEKWQQPDENYMLESQVEIQPLRCDREKSKIPDFPETMNNHISETVQHTTLCVKHDNLTLNPVINGYRAPPGI